MQTTRKHGIHNKGKNVVGEKIRQLFNAEISLRNSAGSYSDH